MYWQNPGDSGLAPTLQWAAQPEVSFGEIQWPFPEPIPVEHLMNYGYNGDVLLPIPVTVAENYSGSHITFKANARWLVCKVECVPGKADLSLTLPVKPNGAAAGAQQALFEQAFNKVPQSLSLQGAPVQFSDNQVSLQLYAKTPLFKDVKHVQFFPITGNLVEYANPATLQWHNNLLKITQATSLEFTGAPESIKGVIVIDNAQAWQFSIAVE